MKIKDDLYFDILKYGRDNLSSFVTKESIFGHLKNIGYEFDNIYQHALWSNLYLKVFKGGDNYSMTKFILTPEAYFQLLEHERLIEARNSSKWSLRVAITAIIISIGLTLVSIFVNKNTTVIVSPNNNTDNMSLIYNLKDSTYEVYKDNIILLESNKNNTDSLSIKTLDYIDNVLKENK